jgi:hypothetical protein
MNKNFKIALASIALVSAPIAIGVVSAQTAPAATAPSTNYTNVFLGKLASALGVSTDKLTAGLKTAGEATIDEALKNQDITKTQADRLRQEVASGRPVFLGHDFVTDRGMGGPGMGMGGNRGMGGPGGNRGMGDRGPGFGGGQAVFDAAAKALGLSSADLQTQLRSGQTLEQIATAKKVDIKTVQAAMLAALKTQLDQDVKDGRITQAQADDIYNRAKSDPNFGLRGPQGGPRR